MERATPSGDFVQWQPLCVGLPAKVLGRGSGTPGRLTSGRAADREASGMRHVLGLFLAAILAAVMFAGAGWGTWRIEVLQAAGTRLTSSAGLVALASLVGTGLL